MSSQLEKCMKIRIYRIGAVFSSTLPHHHQINIFLQVLLPLRELQSNRKLLYSLKICRTWNMANVKLIDRHRSHPTNFITLAAYLWASPHYSNKFTWTCCRSTCWPHHKSLTWILIRITSDDWHFYGIIFARRYVMNLWLCEHGKGVYRIKDGAEVREEWKKNQHRASQGSSKYYIGCPIKIG